MIRDQANKTLDLYLQRVRKHGSTMPDTVLPPPNAPEATKEAARIGTSNDKSWAGWAISSFTNKTTAANGEIQPTTNGSRPVETPVSRPASVPRPAALSPSAQLDAPSPALRPNPPPFERSISEQPRPVTKVEEDEANDAFEAWGTMDDEDQQKEDDPSTAAASSTYSPPPTTTQKLTPVPYDDGGEPDFAGWLAAQSKAKTKKALPKGLNKTSTSTASKPATAPATSRTAKPKPKVLAAPAKKIDTTPKEPEEDDWGDAW